MECIITSLTRKSNPYPKGLKISAGTKKSISGSECHSIFSVEEYSFFFNFLSLNFLPKKGNYTRTKEQDSFVVVFWHEIREPFQGYQVPVNNPQDGNNKMKTKASSLGRRQHKALLVRARKRNCTQETRGKQRVKQPRKVFLAATLRKKGKNRPTRNGSCCKRGCLNGNDHV